MLMGGPKKFAAVIVGSKKMDNPKSSVVMEILEKMKEIRPEGMNEESEGNYNEALMSQAKLVMKAIKADDAEKFAEYMKNFVSMCESMEEMKEGEEEGES